MVSSKSVFKNLIWQFLEKSGTKIVSFIVSIILARLLLPSDYGILAVVLAFVNLCDVFISYGFGNALIQKKDADDIDFSSVFYAQMLLSVVIYGILYFLAPVVANFYGEGYEVVSPAIRVLGLNIIAIASSNVHASLIAKKMKFKLSFFATLGGTILSAVIGVVMAIKGMGVWALVAQSLSSSVINAIILWIVSRWYPKLLFSIKRLKLLLGYGWKLLCVGLLENLYLEIRTLLIGKMYDADSLAHYNKGEQFPKIISVNINSSIKTVLFSAIAKEQDNPDVLKKMMKRAMKTSGYLLFPFLIGLFVTADHLVPLILTEKWVPCIPYLRVFCIVYLFMPLQTTNMQVYKGIGRSGISLALEIIKKTIGVFGLLISMRWGSFAIACAYAITTVINAAVSAIPNKKMINYGLLEQIVDILPNVLLSASFAIPVFLIGRLNLHHGIILVLQIIIAIIIYLGVSIGFKVEPYRYIKNLLISKKQKERN